jgi:outer membrane protein OmpA-like peptidoglycan-associated protein
MPPKVVSWDGTDDKGEPAVYNMQLQTQMEITDDAGNTAVSKKVPFMVGFLVKQEKGKRVVYMFNQNTIFKGQSDELTVNGVLILDQLAAKLAKMGGFTQVNIVAYTDAVGSKQSNMALSQKQAAVIADRLKNLPAEIKTVGAGAELYYIKDKPSKWDMRYEIELY